MSGMGGGMPSMGGMGMMGMPSMGGMSGMSGMGMGGMSALERPHNDDPNSNEKDGTNAQGSQGAVKNHGKDTPPATSAMHVPAAGMMGGFGGMHMMQQPPLPCAMPPAPCAC